MLVSIIINNFNYGAFVNDAILSALNQTYPRVEVIVVDDGSTDNSREIILSFGERITSIFKENGGQASAFNAGFNLSKGDLILFLDSDDILYPTAIAAAVSTWTPPITKVQFKLDIIDESGIRTGKSYPTSKLAEGNVLAELLKNGSYATAPTSGNVFSRDFLANVMPIPEKLWVSAADCYLIHSAPFFGNVASVHESLGQYRMHSSTLSLSSFISNGRLSLKRIHFQVLRDTFQLKLIQDLAARRGLQLASENYMNGHGHYKFRFVSMKLDPSAHPVPEDTLLQLTATLIGKIWKARDLAPQSQIVLTIWVALVCAAPLKLAVPLIAQGISPAHRSRAVAGLSLLHNSTA